MSRTSKERQRMARKDAARLAKVVPKVVPDEDLERFSKLTTWLEAAKTDGAAHHEQQLLRLARLYWVVGAYKTASVPDNQWVELYSTEEGYHGTNAPGAIVAELETLVDVTSPDFIGASCSVPGKSCSAPYEEHFKMTQPILWRKFSEAPDAWFVGTTKDVTALIALMKARMAELHTTWLRYATLGALRYAEEMTKSVCGATFVEA